jgi:Encapsulating protein for peroxidase
VSLVVARMVDPEDVAARALFLRAANVVGRIEDAVVFNGLDGHDAEPSIPQGIPRIYRIAGGEKWDSLLKAGNRHPVLLNLRWAQDGETLVFGASRAIRQLTRRGQFGPFVIVLGPDLFEIACTPDQKSSDLSCDRIIQFLGGGSLHRCASLEGGSGVVVALGGAPVEIVVAPDVSVEFLRMDAAATFVFRVFEKIALRIKDSGDIASLQAGESLARVRGKSASPRRGKRR